MHTLTVTRVRERASTKFGTTTEAYFWEFPLVPGAHDYTITLCNQAGGVQQRYCLLQSDLEATALTPLPILTSDDPFPPAIPVREELTGIVRGSFYRRESGIRYLLVWGSGFDPKPYYDNNPIHVVVAYEDEVL